MKNLIKKVVVIILSVLIAFYPSLFTTPRHMHISATTTLLYPLPENSFALTQKYSASHKAVDWGTLGRKIGVPIYAVDDGVVRTAASCGTYGILIVLWHENIGRYSAYAHCENTNYVTVGQKVKRGDTIATVGMTGNTSGPHLHFMIFKQMQSSSSNYPSESTCENPLSYSYTYDKPPLVAKPSVSKLIANTYSIFQGQSITFTASSDTATEYTIGIDKDGKRIKTEYMPGGKLTCTFNEGGTYSAYVTSANSSGYCDSARITFTVMSPVNIGNEFYAFIMNNNCWKQIASTNTDNVELQTENGNGNQLWRFVRQEDGSYVIYNGKDGKYNTYVLDSHESKEAGSNVYVYKGYVNGIAQQWYIYGTENAYYLRSKCTDCVLDLSNDDSSDGTNIQMFTYNATNAQKFAIYKVKMYNVSFDSKGGECSLSSKLVAGESNYGDLPTPSRSNYSFLGWYIDADLSKQVTKDTKVTLLKDHMLYAKWKANEYEIFLDANGGTILTTDKTVSYNETYGKLPVPVRANYTFDGWYTETSGGVKITENSVVSALSSHILYAHWTPNQYNVNLIYNDGTDKTETIKVTYDSTYSNLSLPKRDGYNFNGWYTAKDGGTLISTSSKVTITSDQTLYAHWSNDKIMIIFEVNGGTVEKSEKLVTYDKSYGVFPETTKSGYIFAGWYLDEEFTKPVSESDTVKITSNHKIYAKWDMKRYIVTFEATGGISDVKNKQVVQGKPYGVLPEATKENEEFFGWFTKDGVEITSESIVDLENDIILYAKWKSDFIVKGDANKDGVVTVADLMYLQKYLLNIETISLGNIIYVDINDDGNLNIVDFIMLKQMLVDEK